MKNLILDWIADLKHFQEMPFEVSADIDLFLEEHSGKFCKEVLEMQEFLADRHEALETKICELRVAVESGSMVVRTEDLD
jgi:hypothetical protein